MIFEGLKPQKPRKSFARFQNHKTGDVVVANFKLGGKIDERLTYEFGYNKVNFKTKEEALEAMKVLRKRMVGLYGETHHIGRLRILYIVGVPSKDAEMIVNCNSF